MKYANVLITTLSNMIALLLWEISMWKLVIHTLKKYMRHTISRTISTYICFKNIDNYSSCIDLILTNQDSGTFETGLSDFHDLRYTVAKS